ncbi:MAG: LysM domain-containing protein, partial [Bacillota bacterium]
LTGPDVRAVQHALQVRHLYPGPINGVYDAAVARAVVALQSLTGALPNGRVDRDIYRALVVSCIFNAEWAVPPEFPSLPESPQLLPEVVYEQGPLTCRLGPLYRAGPGETLFTIADRFGYLPQDVVAVNPHIPNPDRIPEGEVVALPFPTERRR